MSCLTSLRTITYWQNIFQPGRSGKELQLAQRHVESPDSTSSYETVVRVETATVRREEGERTIRWCCVTRGRVREVNIIRSKTTTPNRESFEEC